MGLTVAAAGCVAMVVSLAYLFDRSPPGCTDPRTLALVRQELRRALSPLPVPGLTDFVTLAGSAFGIRYACTADFAHPDELRLANGTLLGSIHYTSQLAAGTRVQRVTVRLEPILVWRRSE